MESAPPLTAIPANSRVSYEHHPTNTVIYEICIGKSYQISVEAAEYHNQPISVHIWRCRNSREPVAIRTTLAENIAGTETVR